MTTLLVGGMLLSMLHAMIPNHWIPLIAVGRAEHWAHRRTLSVTALAGFAHTASTVIIGLLVGVLGVGLASRYAEKANLFAPVVLVILGVFYVVLDRMGRGGHGHSHEHGHHHHHGDDSGKAVGGATTAAIVSSLAVMMFFSPCIEIEAYYFTAVTHGWMGVIAVSAIYVIFTVLGMVLLVHLGLKGVERLRWHYLEHHERLVTGVLLLSLGIVGFLVDF